MRISFCVATLVAVACLGLSVEGANAQQAPAARPAAPAGPAGPGGRPTNTRTAPVMNPSCPNGIAVIDVTYILENYSKLKGAMDYYKNEAQKAEDLLKKQHDAIVKKSEGLKAFQPGSPEFKKLEEELTKAESDWKLDVASRRRDFAEKEGTYYLKAYQELTGAVEEYSKAHGIQLVLRFNGAPIDPNNREMVQMEVFKMVMYYDRNIDITDVILADMNRKAAAVANQPRPGAPAVPRR